MVVQTDSNIANDSSEEKKGECVLSKIAMSPSSLKSSMAMFNSQVTHKRSLNSEAYKMDVKLRRQLNE